MDVKEGSPIKSLAEESVDDKGAATFLWKLHKNFSCKGIESKQLLLGWEENPKIENFELWILKF